MNRARFADRDPVICLSNAGDGGQVNALTDLTHVFFVAVRSHGTHTVHPSREDGSYGEQTRVCVSLGPTGLTGRWRVIGRPAAWTQQLRGNLSHEPLRSKTKKGGRIILTFRRCRVPDISISRVQSQLILKLPEIQLVRCAKCRFSCRVAHWHLLKKKQLVDADLWFEKGK